MASAPAAKLLLVTSIPHYRQLRRMEPALLGSHLPVTWDIGVAALLEDEARPFRELWDYLSSEELERNWETAWELCGRWHLLPDTELECFGSHPLKWSSLEMLFAFETALNSATAFSRLMAADLPSEVVGTGDQAPIYRNGPPPIERPVSAVTEAVIRWQCDRAGVPFKVCRIPAPPLQRLRPPPLHRQRVERATLERRRSFKGQPLIMIVDNGQNERDLLALESEIRRLDRFRLVRISELLRPDYPLLPPIPPSIQLGVSRSQARSFEARRAYRGPYEFVFANSHLDFQFQGLWDEIRRSCASAAFFAPIVQSLRPDAVLFGADCFTCEGLMRDIAMRAGATVGVLVHGGIAPRRGWKDIRSPADITFVWGEADRESFLDQGIPSDRLSVVGSLRYHRSHTDPSGTQERPPRSLELLARLGLRSQRRIVCLLTAQTNSGLLASGSEPREHRRSLRELLRWAFRNPEVGLIIKAHPTYDHVEWYRYLREKFPPNVCFAEGETLSDVLSVSDVAVLLNCGTTAALEALPHVPVVYAGTCRRGVRSQEILFDREGVTRVASINQLTGELERLFDDESYLGDCLNRQRELLPHLLSRGSIHPAARVVAALQEKLAPTGPRLEPERATNLLSELLTEKADEIVDHWMSRLPPPGNRAGFYAATAIALAARDETPSDLCRTLATFGDRLSRQATRNEVTNLVLATFLSASLGSLNRCRWLEVIALTREAVRSAPLAAMRCGQLWRVAGRAAVSYGIGDWRSVARIVLTGIRRDETPRAAGRN
jgi:hypothetical protein